MKLSGDVHAIFHLKQAMVFYEIMGALEKHDYLKHNSRSASSSYSNHLMTLSSFTWGWWTQVATLKYTVDLLIEGPHNLTSFLKWALEACLIFLTQRAEN